mmetsp:Transcript_24905/g.38070  ORF Transcript_24905/g.38070 Transcript_24905/m.38070 type:complete len:81 (-) Transcript_24905:894-1136(-)
MSMSMPMSMFHTKLILTNMHIPKRKMKRAGQRGKESCSFTDDVRRDILSHNSYYDGCVIDDSFSPLFSRKKSYHFCSSKK